MLTRTWWRRILTRVEPPADARPICETWGDHDFSGMKFLYAGKDRLRGGFQMFVNTCDRCGKRIYETRWTDLRSAGIGGVQP